MTGVGTDAQRVNLLVSSIERIQQMARNFGLICYVCCENCVKCAAAHFTRHEDGDVCRSAGTTQTVLVN